MIHMCVTDEDVGDLMGNARRQTTTVTQVEQQAAGLVTQSNVQQRVTEHPVDQGRIGAADPGDRDRAIRKSPISTKS